MTDSDGQSQCRLIYGTMRLHEVDRSVSDWVTFFIEMRNLGVTKLHSSSEYDSYPLLCEILRQLAIVEPTLLFQHIVKLAEPSFDDVGFDGERLKQKIHTYRKELGAGQIDDIQWMWRHDLKNDEDRILQFEKAADHISEVSQSLKEAGCIKRFLCFPYSISFAETAIDRPGVDGLAIYRNRQETEYDAAVRKCKKLDKTAIAIRPLNAGRVLEEEDGSARESFDFALDLEPLEAGIVSSSNMAHLRQLLD